MGAKPSRVGCSTALPPSHSHSSAIFYAGQTLWPALHPATSGRLGLHVASTGQGLVNERNTNTGTVPSPAPSSPQLVQHSLAGG
jgi:hypothetical protein